MISEQNYSCIIVGTFFPRDSQQHWHNYYENVQVCRIYLDNMVFYRWVKSLWDEICIQAVTTGVRESTGSINLHSIWEFIGKNYVHKGHSDFAYTTQVLFHRFKVQGLEILCPDVLLPYFRKVKTNQVENFLRCLIECQVILGMWWIFGSGQHGLLSCFSFSKVQDFGGQLISLFLVFYGLWASWTITNFAKDLLGILL